jgi:membrane fusion protein (multidrug efflux system)
MKLRSIILPLMAISFSFVNPCSQKTDPNTAIPDDETVFDVDVIYPQFRSVPRLHEVDGTFDVSETITITASAAGTIDQILVSVGDTVRKDDPLVQISNIDITDRIDLLRAKVKEYEARLKVAKAKIVEAGHEEGSVTVEETSFLDDEPIDEPSTPTQFGNANEPKIIPQTQKALVDVLSAQIERANKEADALDKKLLELTLLSPTGGTVMKIPVSESNKVSEKDPLMELSKIDPMSVSFNLPEDVASFVDKNSAVTVSPTDAPEVTGQGQVYFINPDIDKQTSTILLKAHVSNENSLIKGGQKAKVKVATRRTDRVVDVPKNVLVYENDQVFLFTVQGKRAKLIEVKVGNPTTDGKIQVSGDVHSEDPIIINRPSELENNSYVKMKETEEKEEDSL